jgi:hypothetical protein
MPRAKGFTPCGRVYQLTRESYPPGLTLCRGRVPNGSQVKVVWVGRPAPKNPIAVWVQV